MGELSGVALPGHWSFWRDTLHQRRPPGRGNGYVDAGRAHLLLVIRIALQGALVARRAIDTGHIINRDLTGMGICSYFVLTMPEPIQPKKRGEYRLADAAKVSRYARISCSYCKTERFYLVEELRVVFGNVECDDAMYRNDWRCVKCGKLNSLDMHMENPSAAELQRIPTRRIARIDYVRKITWRED